MVYLRRNNLKICQEADKLALLFTKNRDHIDKQFILLFLSWILMVTITRKYQSCRFLTFLMILFKLLLIFFRNNAEIFYHLFN